MNNLQRVIDEGRLLRGAWFSEQDGRQMLCAFTALANDPAMRPDACPASLCPPWLAHLIPWLDDEPAEKDWLPLMRRLAAVADRLHLLPPETEYRVRALCVREAMRHTRSAAVLAVCERVAGLCDRAGRGERVGADEWGAARAAAWEAREAAWEAAWEAVREAVWAAAAWEAEGAVWAAAAWEAEGAASRLAGAILTEIETTLEAA